MDISIFALFMQMGLAVKCIITLLFIFSILSWSVIIQKSVNFITLRRQFREFEQLFWSGQSLETVCKSLKNHHNIGLAAIFMSAMSEWKKSCDKGARSPIGIQDRIDRMMDVAIARELEEITEKLSFLGSMSSAGLLVGILGAVLGMMGFFQSIAGYYSNNVVSIPGIIESLISILLGLCVSIPSSIAYNKFIEDSKKFAMQMEGFANEFSAILSRQTEGNIS
ncbi:MotA/TolQ/ExbB proton channel family protein [Candidatus Liberibacter asiaticus]|nr:MotA/TolQ/ExbB proton channel family protein [Candidatus Liberibacter asiaticus]ASK53265.1 biopolymer transporter ExbB [Candidatus Liberibacter asiaticus]KIH96325.1 biopolymer transporter ExbB [Candidatus Liberibacter asiaticus]KPG63348.1 biopolymer transporter ExbB [Candidatus Liberibacter asiaticus]KRF69253.1 biopolymer transporter ExbB [Candidatus Liberibacter asiaticus]MBA2917537.1 biopolymer transporter ExbB [Candidatus Liberibacter asiaticus]